MDYADDRRRAAAMRSYVTPAVITLALYFVLWVPGLVANIVYLVASREDRRQSGVTPQGQGCLWALLLVFGLVPLLGVCLLVSLSASRGVVDDAFATAVATAPR